MNIALKGKFDFPEQEKDRTAFESQDFANFKNTTVDYVKTRCYFGKGKHIDVFLETGCASMIMVQGLNDALILRKQDKD